MQSVGVHGRRDFNPLGATHAASPSAPQHGTYDGRIYKHRSSIGVELHNDAAPRLTALGILRAGICARLSRTRQSTIVIVIARQLTFAN
ncbi:MAG: hypothetical protein KIS92_22220 [Planctomycetota bacterium]|nr:hypothetical protein [Planctomycetota bacterium]